MIKKTTAICITIFLFLVCSGKSHCQKRWFFGVDFLPGYTKYTFASQKTNLNLLSGIFLKKELKRDKLNLSIGIQYFGNRLYGGDSTCYICTPNIVSTDYKGQFIVVPIGVEYALLEMGKSILFVNGGFSNNFQFYFKEINFHQDGSQLEFLDKRFLPQAIYTFVGIIARYKLGKSSFFYFNPLIKARSFSNRRSYVTYQTYLGVDLGVYIEI